MTDVYILVPTTEKDDDKYERNERARQELLGVFSSLIKFSGVDESYSLFKAETRRKWQSFICGPLSVITISLFLYAFFRAFHRISNALSWEWGEIFILTFLAFLSLTSAFALSSWTRSLLFLDFHDAWNECGKKMDDRVPSNLRRSVICVFCLVLFTGTAIVSHVKYAVQKGHGAHGNETASLEMTGSTRYLVDYLCEGDTLIALWGSILSALALIVYGSLHAIAAATIKDFNKDMQEAADQEALATRLDAFATRHAAVVNLVRVLSKRISFFAGVDQGLAAGRDKGDSLQPATAAGVAANSAAIYLNFAYKWEMSGLSRACLVLWTILALATKAIVLFYPARLQKHLNDGLEILYRNDGIWKKAHAAPIAQSMVIRVQNSHTKVALFNCLVLTQWTGRAVMMLPAVIGGALLLIKRYIV